ncbi:MAG: hypothetical protein SCARUB_02339 [Candidatus Scalindua rubra]|uniref:DUF262 domain-containing protein n=1 Tax=Candidatus Scalindua rubra TaxID=1872076 RepID=A0A1E3XAC0_9BACT|nr:MAG: hypothetical protein SCARUB_02339 [Candidatus Scalindua rubra]
MRKPNKSVEPTPLSFAIRLFLGPLFILFFYLLFYLPNGVAHLSLAAKKRRPTTRMRSAQIYKGNYMQAKETKLQEIIEGTKQYVIPLFQRSYSWGKKEWDILWNDLVELSEMENPRTHFIGSIVNMPTISVPEGVSKYLLIDGQQRLTTIFIILALLRDISKQNGETEFAEEINNTLIVNPYKKDLDFFKLLPTQVDRVNFQELVKGKLNDDNCQLSKAYKFFERKLKRKPINNEILKKVITTYLSIVSIVLDADDNPYLVFESLNAKGRPLTQADLIRNYFFMRIHTDEQNRVYNDHWRPMENKLGERLTEYIRHYLMREGSVINQNDVYYTLKGNVGADNSIDYLSRLSCFSEYYQKLVFPVHESNEKIQKYLKRLNRIEVTTAYPLLINLYHKYDQGLISDNEFVEILKTIENYLIRRFVCGIPTNQLNKIFPSVIPSLVNKHSDDILNGVKSILQSKGYPKNPEFRQRITESKLYGSGDRAIKTKLILESIEGYFGHKEQVPFEDLTIEHIMPQTLSEWWQNYLGEDWELVYELYLHNIGNLTLTAYNTELSNDNFSTKRKYYCDSHIELNKYFANVESWGKNAIEKRATYISEIILKIWPYFGSEDYVESEIKDVTGTTPQGLWILGQYFQVNSWRDVLEQTLNTISELEPDKFDTLIKEFPRLVGKEKSKYRAVRELKNGTFVEINLSAQSIQRFCYQTLETIELTAEDWKVQTV